MLGVGVSPVIIGDATRIYALCEFPSMVPRYVGKTIRSLRLRLASHLQVANKNPRLPVGRWLAKQKREGREVCIKWLETVPANMDWAERERFWISTHRQAGAKLLNLTEGGEGLPGHKFSDEHRAKISAALKTGQNKSCISCGTEFWRKANQIAKGNDKFCSKSCSNKFNKGGWACRSKK